MIVLNQFALAGGPVPWTATLTIGSGETTADLTNYPLYVDLAHMPASFWANTNEGKDLRASIGGSQVPVDVIWCSVAEQKGAAFIKIPSFPTATSTTINLSGDAVSDRAAANSTYGSQAVWSPFLAVFLLGITAGDDRTGGAQGRIFGNPDFFELIATTAGDVDSHQGVDSDDTYDYTTDTNAIYKRDAAGSLVTSNLDPIGDAAIGGSPTINHCGDVLHHNGLLYIPMEAYPAVGGLYNAHIGVFNASDLSFVTAYNISAQGHEAASIAHCDRDDLLYIVDYDANNSTIYKYQTNGTYVGTLTTSVAITNRQGITWHWDYFWISSDTNDETVRVSYTGDVTLAPAGGFAGIGFGQPAGIAYEGIGHRDDALLQLIDPGATERFEAWRPLRMSKGAQGGISCPGSVNGSLIANGRASHTTFTMGCTLIVDAKAQNRCAVSYLDESAASGTSRRAIIAFRNSTSTLALWDFSNSWLEPSPTVNPTLGQSYRVHGVWQGTTARRIYIDGTQRNSAAPITAVPNDLDTIIIGHEDADTLERFSGDIGYVYLAPSALSAAWIAAEHSNLNDPANFYSIT